MPIQVRPDYVNPLTMMKQKTSEPKLEQSSDTQQDDKVKELQTKQQQLQNEILLMKSAGTDSPGASATEQKKLQDKLEKVTSELNSAEAQCTDYSENNKNVQSLETFSGKRRSVDVFEKETNNRTSSGIYQVQQDEDKYKVSFQTYSEE